jgi:hypothetical protein
MKKLLSIFSMWDDARVPRTDIQDLVDGYALFQQLKLNRITFLA